MKWKGYSDAENTWEDEENLLDAQHLLKEFNKNEEKEGDPENDPEAPNSEPPAKKQRREMDPKKQQDPGAAKRQRKAKEEVGFDHGDKVQEIVGARIIKNVLHLYVQWKGKNVCSFVPADVCNKKIPQKVIQFYESRIKFERPLDDNM
uniref:Chromo domain-containing protein n=1 Tax=Arcella intermedia TaxID=1963864 RepID=A0A6B2LJR9_9EUKA